LWLLASSQRIDTGGQGLEVGVQLVELRRERCQTPADIVWLLWLL
jgi:hypothetical protein